jgi:RNA 3'-terminal phosphate cyclase-like protein
MVKNIPFRIQIIQSLLSGKPVKMKNIRQREDEPGLKDYEVNMLKLIDSITNGTRTDINETGTSLYFVPGLLMGGELEHDCKCDRGIGYFLQVLFCLAPFCKQPFHIKLTGITNDPVDVSIDYLKYSALPIMKRFLGTDENLEIRILKRGAKPDGGGEVLFRCPTRMKLLPCNLTDPGKIKRIRGVAYAMRVAPAICNRLVETAKGILLKFLPDVYIISDHQKRDNAGKSPAFGITLVAETINGTFLCAEACSLPKGTKNGDPSVPEDIATQAAHNLLEEIYRGGCVDSANQHLAFLYMALNQKDVSRILTGILSPYSIQFLRGMKESFDLMFKVEPCRNQNVDLNYAKLKAEKEKEEAEAKAKKKRKRNEQLPQDIAAGKEIEDAYASDKEEDPEEEAKKRKLKLEEEEREKNAHDYLKLGHEKLLISCVGIGFTNFAKNFL